MCDNLNKKLNNKEKKEKQNETRIEAKKRKIC